MAPQLFAPDSVFNRPAPSGVDPSSADLVNALTYTVKSLQQGWVDMGWDSYSTPVYRVTSGQSRVPVALDGYAGDWKQGLRDQLARGVPLPPNARPAAGADGHMTIWAPDTNELWEFYKFRGGTNPACALGGYTASASTFSGVYDRDLGATATSLAVAGGVCRLDELREGVVPHALALNLPPSLVRHGQIARPATRGDGQGVTGTTIPEGTLFKLNPAYDVEGLLGAKNTTGKVCITKILAFAAQKYGMIVRDCSGGGVSIFGEDPRGADDGTNPYGSRWDPPQPGLWCNSEPRFFLQRDFPWDQLQVAPLTLVSYP